MIIHPSQLTFQDWADSMSYLIEDSSTVIRLEDPRQWRDWARNLLSQPTFLSQSTPNPDEFRDWGEWAMRLFSTVEFQN